MLAACSPSVLVSDTSGTSTGSGGAPIVTSTGSGGTTSTGSGGVTSTGGGGTAGGGGSWPIGACGHRYYPQALYQLRAASIYADLDGAFVVTGLFDDGVLDLGTGTTLHAATGERVLFRARFAPDGQALWLDGVGLGGDSFGMSAMDASGNHGFVISGGPLDLGSGPLGEWNSLYFLKIDPAGAPLWVRTIKNPGTTFWFTPAGVRVDPAGNMLVLGSFLGTLDLGAGPLSGPATGNDGLGCLLAKLDEAGNTVWSRALDTSGVCDPVDIAVDAAGNSIVYGSMYGGASGATITAAGTSVTVPQAARRPFILALDPEGHPLWLRTMGAGDAEAGGLAVGADGSMVVTGWGVGSLLDFGGQPLPETGMFVSALGPDGGSLWTRSFASAFGEGVATAPGGDWIVAATCASTVDLGNGPIPGSASHAGLVARLDSTGHPLAAGVDAMPVLDDSRVLATNAAGDALMIGTGFEGGDANNSGLTVYSLCHDP